MSFLNDEIIVYRKKLVNLGQEFQRERMMFFFIALQKKPQKNPGRLLSREFTLSQYSTTNLGNTD